MHVCFLYLLGRGHFQSGMAGFPKFHFKFIINVKFVHDVQNETTSTAESKTAFAVESHP